MKQKPGISRLRECPSGTGRTHCSAAQMVGRSAKLVPALKIRTRSSVGSWKESRLGVDQIVQFDWNLAVGDLELPEAEFREIVKKSGAWCKSRANGSSWTLLILRRSSGSSEKEGLSLGEILHLRLLGPAASTPVEKEAGAEDDALQVEVELSGQLAQMVEQLGNLTQIPVPEVASSFRGALRPYQQMGTAWMLFLRRFGLGCCLADDMGLGKTIQWITPVKSQGRRKSSPAGFTYLSHVGPGQLAKGTGPLCPGVESPAALRPAAAQGR